MKILISYNTAYRYRTEVSFSPHIYRLFPRTDHYVTVRRTEFATNEGTDIQHRRDLYDNHVASCIYPGLHAELTCHLEIELELRRQNPFHFLLAPHATNLPFQYTSREHLLLSPYLKPQFEPVKLPFWKQGATPQPTVEAIVALNQSVFDNLQYERRETGAALSPSQTLERGAGACRDFTVLTAEVLRGVGVAARLTSGYLVEGEGDENGERRAEGALHAWVEAFLPGAGWVGLDPTNGIFCNETHIAAAVGLTTQDVTPVQGTYFHLHGNKVDSEMTASLEITPCPE